MSTVKDCLAHKPQRVIQVSPNDTVKTALELMKTHRVRAVLVVEAGRLAGIISQGDCAIRAFLPGRDAANTRVSEIMTADPLSVKPGDPMELCMGLMATRGFRHLPVVAQDQVVGVVSIGDVVKQMMNELGEHVSFLETYIKGHSA
jgi:CBS domain-containing protein